MFIMYNILSTFIIPIERHLQPDFRFIFFKISYLFHKNTGGFHTLFSQNKFALLIYIISIIYSFFLFLGKSRSSNIYINKIKKIVIKYNKQISNKKFQCLFIMIKLQQKKISFSLLHYNFFFLHFITILN